MSFTVTTELTISELVAFAWVEYKTDRFTCNKLTTSMCSLLSENFKVRTLQVIENLLQGAHAEGLVELTLGPRGGSGFRITEHGAQLVSEVELPLNKFARRATLADERTVDANSNAGPAIVGLLKTIPESCYRERKFIADLFEQWLTQGWLSTKQVTKMAETALQYGEYLEPRHYAGNALMEWRIPYIEQRKRLIAEQRARAQELSLAREKVQKEQEQAKALVREKNTRIKNVLKELERAGKLAALDELVTMVFPTVNLNQNSKAVAFAGHGSKELRVCISALAFGQPPSMIWDGIGSKVQPDVTSALWQTLIGHPTLQKMDSGNPYMGIFNIRACTLLDTTIAGSMSKAT